MKNDIAQYLKKKNNIMGEELPDEGVMTPAVAPIASRQSRAIPARNAVVAPPEGGWNDSSSILDPRLVEYLGKLRDKASPISVLKPADVEPIDVSYQAPREEYVTRGGVGADIHAEPVKEEPLRAPLLPAPKPNAAVSSEVEDYLKKRIAQRPQYEGPLIGSGQARGYDAMSKAGSDIANIFLALNGVPNARIGSSNLTEGSLAREANDVMERKSRDAIASQLQAQEFNAGESLLARDLSNKKLIEERLRAKAVDDRERELAQGQKDFTDSQLTKKQEFEKEQNRLDRIARIQAAAASAGRATDDKIETDVQRLARAVGDDAVFVTQKLGRIEKILNDPKYKNDLPGIGAADMRAPDFLTSDVGLQLRGDAVGVVADLMKIQSGATVTPAEAERKAREYGISPTSTEAAFRLGIEKLKKDTARSLQAKQAGFRNEVVDTYKSRGGLTADKLMVGDEAVKGGPESALSDEELNAQIMALEAKVKK